MNSIACAGTTPQAHLLFGPYLSLSGLTPVTGLSVTTRYVPKTTDTLYEEFFHCHDLGVQLAPVIERFRNSEMAKTGNLPLSLGPALTFWKS